MSFQRKSFLRKRWRTLYLAGVPVRKVRNGVALDIPPDPCTAAAATLSEASNYAAAFAVGLSEWNLDSV